MASITLTGTPAETSGDLPRTGELAPDFALVKTDLSTLTRSDFAGRKLLLNIFLSVDTDVCPLAIKRFDQELGARDDVAVLCISADLPFALSRYLRESGLSGVEAASCFRDSQFGKDYGVVMTTGPLLGMLARAVLVLDENGVVTYSQLVSEINDQPDYDAVMAALE